MERFVVEDRFDATVAELIALLDDPALYERLQSAMPALERIQPLERTDEGDVVRKRVRYVPRTEGKIPAFGRAFVKPSMLSWIEESTFDRREARFTYRIVPNLPASWRDRFDTHGEYRLLDDGGRVLRRLEGEIHVRVPLFGGRVERMLRKEVETNFRAESQAIAAWLRERRGG